MTRKYIFLSFLLICISSTISISQTVLQGKITDSFGGAIIGAAVTISQSNVTVKGVATDFDGNCIFTNINPGTYDVQIVYIGLVTKRITGVILYENQTTRLNVILEPNLSGLEEICMSSYKVPLVDFDQMYCDTTIFSPTIYRGGPMRTKELAAISAGLSSDEDRNISSVRGSRNTDPIYGVKETEVKKERLLARVKRWFGKTRSKEVTLPK